jgi:hypothetical protein
MAVLTIVLLASAVAGPHTAYAGSGRPLTFEGSCKFSVEVAFEPPMTNSTRPTTQQAEGDGRCTGTLTRANGNRKELDHAPAVYHADSHGDVSCGSSDATGSGYLQFGRRKLRFEFSESRVASVTNLTLKGEAGGVFKASASPTDDPVDILTKCAGAGVRRTAVDVSGETDPTISG